MDKPTWIRVGEVGVDAGLCWIGDPTYLHGDPPAEWGKTWRDFLDTLREKEKEKGYPLPVQFNYDLGHAGLGVCSSTGFGDGVYPVFAQVVDKDGWGQRVAELRVVFIPEENTDDWREAPQEEI